MAYIVIKGDELYHHGIKGMKWGVRRYQNADGSLKAAGRKRYTDYKPAIKEYRDSYDKASSMNDAADAKWRDVQDARKNLGRTAIGRTIASARNKTEAAKKYNRMYDEWSKMQDDADDQWRDADEKYKNTGGNRLTRIANNIRYDTKFGSAKSGETKPLTDEERAARNAKIKKAAIAAGAVAATAALAYAGHKYMKHVNSEADHNLGRAKAEAIIDAFDRSENAKSSNRDKYYAGDIDLATRFRKDIAASDRLHATKRSIDRITNDSDMKRKARNAVVREDLNYARDRALRKKYDRSSYKEAAYGRTRSILDARTTVEERLRDRANEYAERMKNRR